MGRTTISSEEEAVESNDTTGESEQLIHEEMDEGKANGKKLMNAARYPVEVYMRD